MRFFHGLPRRDGDGSRLWFLGLGCVLIAATLIPLWGIRIPILVDLPEQLAVAKLFSEKLSGASTLDLEISGYYGYRFFPYFAAFTLKALAALGIGIVHLPAVITAGFVIVNGVVLLTVMRQWTGEASCNGTWLLVILPLTSIYASAFYLGLVNYFPAIAFLALAISLAERWFEWGGAARLAGFFAALCLVYVCHPFAVAFWIVWALCRVLVRAAAGGERRWRRVAALAGLTCVVIGYHLAAAPKALALDRAQVSLNDVVPPWPHWLKYRAMSFLNGDMFALEYSIASNLYAVAILVLVLACLAHLVARRSFSSAPSQMLLTAVLFYFVASAPDEGALPKPEGLGLEYDTRFASTAPLILMVAACIYAWNIEAFGRTALRRVAEALGVIAVVVSLAQLVRVHQSMESFDRFARPNLPAIADGNDAVSGKFVSKFNADGSYIRHYRCLFVADCVPSDSWFEYGNDFGLYAVRLIRP